MYARFDLRKRRLPRKNAASSQYEMTIICNHNWIFFHPWRPRPNAADIAAWGALLDAILGADADESEVASFSGYAARNRP